MVTAIGEQIQVCAHFSEGRIFPLWFIWHDRCYKISSITSRWSTQEGRACCYHFSALTTETCELYELCYHSEQLSWFLAQVAGEG